jgi:phosphoheptose isomerase
MLFSRIGKEVKRDMLSIITNGNNVLVLQNGKQVRDPEYIVAKLAAKADGKRNLYTDILDKIRKN